MGLLKHILINLTFILIWITTFKNGIVTSIILCTTSSVVNFSQAYRIDASIRPLIDVNWLEHEDHLFFDITFVGVIIQLFFAITGYSWMYALTRRPKLSILAALPMFLLNLLHAGTHTLCAPLDVFVGNRKLLLSYDSDFSRRGYPMVSFTSYLPSLRHFGFGSLPRLALSRYSHGRLGYRIALA